MNEAVTHQVAKRTAQTRTSPRRNIWAIATAIVLLGLLGLCGLVIAKLFISPVPYIEFTRARFESNEWKGSTPDHSYDSLRLRMVDDLLENHNPLGLNMQDITELLGPPDTTDYFSDYDMVYYLGLERGSFIAIDGEWLVMNLDENNKVIEAKLVPD